MKAFETITSSILVTSASPLLLLLPLSAFSVVGQDEFQYVTTDGAVTITAYTGPGGAVTIPSAIAGLPVVSIGKEAFRFSSALTSVTIPTNITRIGDYAFTDCKSLSTITVEPDNPSYSSLDGILFDKTRSTLIQFPAGKFEMSGTPQGTYAVPDGVTTICSGAFENCNGVRSVALPGSITNITEAFWDCYSLASVTIPNGITSIGEGAFNYCTSLTSITIPDSVVNIGKWAFNNTGLTTVSIPPGVTNITDSAFGECRSLTAILVDGGNTRFSSVDGVLFDKNQTVLLQYPGGKAGRYSVPDGVGVIAERAFSGCSALTSVIVPKTVTRLGDFAFNDSTFVYRIFFKGNAPSIGVSPFFPESTVYYLPGTTGWGTTFGGSPTAFWDSSTLIGYTTDGNTITVRGYAESGPLRVPDSITGLVVTSIAEGAFSGDQRITSVFIPGTVTNLGRGAFQSCSLASVTLPASLGTIADEAFAGCTSLTDVTIPDGITSIGEKAFWWCYHLRSISIPSSVTSIGGAAFAECSLPSVTLPNSIKGIGSAAFAGSGLTNITIPDGLTNIDEATFMACAHLRTVTIPQSVASIGELAFEDCGSLKAVYFRGNAPAYTDDPFLNTDATAYYLPGTAGWGPTFIGHPTGLWLPQMPTSDASFGMRTNQFGFTITWASDKVVVVEAANDLTQPSWSPATTNTLTGGTVYFSDPQRVKYPRRFYRVRAK